MQLWINAVNIEILKNIENILFSDDKIVAQWFAKNLPGEIYENLSPQYESQVLSAINIRKILGGNVFKNIKGFYFGSEQCEFLIPTLDELKQAIDLVKEFDKKYTTKDMKQFSYITPYYGNPQMRERLIQNLEYLDQNAYNINKNTKIVEIIVNDFGTLKLIQKYKNLKPTIGRLLIKTLKTPLVETFGLEKNIHIPGEMMKNQTIQQINETKKNIGENQKQGINSCNLSNEYFIKFLDKYNIQRAGIDYIQNHGDLYNTKKLIDIYYPFAIIFVGRLCDTAAIENIKKGYYPTDDICSRTCSRYDLSIKEFETVGYKIIQKGNAQYKIQIELDLDKNTLEKYDNRLIYTPMI